MSACVYLISRSLFLYQVGLVFVMTGVMVVGIVMRAMSCEESEGVGCEEDG